METWASRCTAGGTQAGHRVVAVPVDALGLCADTLPDLASRPAAVVVTPAHQYPTGVTLARPGAARSPRGPAATTS